MDSKDIQTRVNALVAAMLAKGLKEPTAQFTIEANVDFRVYMSWKDVTKARSSFSDHNYEFIRSDDIDEAFDKAATFVEKMPTREEALMSQFMGALANVIDLGKDNGVDVEFLNPLQKTMKKLSDNILTDQRAA